MKIRSQSVTFLGNQICHKQKDKVCRVDQQTWQCLYENIRNSGKAVVANFKVSAISAIRIKRLSETSKISGFNVY